MPVNTPSQKYLDNIIRWRTVRDCVEGDDAIKARGELYLNRLSGYTDDEYKAYQDRAVFFDGTSRTAEGLHGLIFAKDPVQTGKVSEAFLKHLKNVDANGTSLDQFASNSTWDAMQAPWGGILVDHVPVPEGATQADVKNGAFLKWYSAESTINWIYSVVDGKSKLSMVVLREDIEEVKPDDEFVSKTTEAYRVLSFDKDNRYIQRVYKKVEDTKKTKDIFVQEGATIYPRIDSKYFDYIPFFTCPGETPEKSMLLGLAKENIGHYQKTAGFENGLHFTSIPSPVAENMEEPTEEIKGKKVVKKIYIGGTKFQFFCQKDDDGNTADVRVKYLEFTGKGLEMYITALNNCLDRMAKLGIQAIGSEKKGVETAEVAQIHRASENGVLGAFARSMSDKITQAVRLMAKWNGIQETETDGWTYELNSHFDYAGASAQILAIMHSARQSNEIPRSVWYNTLKLDGRMLTDDMNFEKFLEEIQKDQTGGHGPHGDDGDEEPSEEGDPQQRQKEK